MTVKIDTLADVEVLLRDRIYGPALAWLLRSGRGTEVTVYRTTRREAYLEEVDQAAASVYDVYDTRAPAVTGTTNPNRAPDEVEDIDTASANVQFDTVVLLGHAAYNPADGIFAADFNDNTICSIVDLEVGDRLFVKRTDGVLKGWKIIEPQHVGATTKVFRRYRVIGIGGAA
jgi:hypothetical protein